MFTGNIHGSLLQVSYHDIPDITLHTKSVQCTIIHVQFNSLESAGVHIMIMDAMAYN